VRTQWEKFNLPLEQQRWTRNYWRFLLGWGAPPPKGLLSWNDWTRLRTLARERAEAYKAAAIAAKGATIYEWPT